jgi:hypothetical protein
MMLHSSNQPVALQGLGLGADPATVIASDLNAYLAGLSYDMEHGTAITPDQFRAVLQGELTWICTDWNQCVGTYGALIDDAVSQYTAAYQVQYLRVTQGQASGTIYLPPTYVAPTPIYTTPPNVLTTTAPTPVYVPQQPTGNVLNPPQGTNAGVTPGTIVNNQAPPPSASGTMETTSVGQPSWFQASTTIAGMDIPNVALISAAALALFLVVGKK